MSPLQVSSEPLRVSAEDGVVLVEADGAAITLTGEAAVASAEALEQAGTQAIGQEMVKEVTSLHSSVDRLTR